MAAAQELGGGDLGVLFLELVLVLIKVLGKLRLWRRVFALSKWELKHSFREWNMIGFFVGGVGMGWFGQRKWE